jgi:hypothetical protein
MTPHTDSSAGYRNGLYRHDLEHIPEVKPSNTGAIIAACLGVCCVLMISAAIAFRALYPLQPSENASIAADIASVHADVRAVNAASVQIAESMVKLNEAVTAIQKDISAFKRLAEPRGAKPIKLVKP